MTDDVVISVRGEASAVVAPDLAALFCQVRTTAAGKAAALATAADVLRNVEADLAGLGGVVAAGDGRRVPLCWVASSASSYEEMYWDRHTDEQRPTGQVSASVNVEVRVRDLELLQPVGAALARHDRIHVHQVSWHVDEDNPAWPRVRADAIKAALQRARDYAAALGGSVSSVEQIADSGLLTAGGEAGPMMRAAAGHVGLAGGGQETPQLDPVPQQLTAVIEARVIAAVPELSL